jgi:hypothetical protein
MPAHHAPQPLTPPTTPTRRSTAARRVPAAIAFAALALASSAALAAQDDSAPAPAPAPAPATAAPADAPTTNPAAKALTQVLGLDDVALITTANAHTLPDVLRAFNQQGKGTIIIDDRVPMAPLPERLSESVRVIDLRSNNAVNVIRGHHPRQVGMWPQYSNLKTGLGKNITFTDVVTPRTPIETWEGVRVPPQKTDFSRAQDYAHYHNHYQNLLIETWNFTDNVNAVSFWADSAALTPGAKSWGGFISARSWPFRWGDYLPEGAPDFKDEDFDAALVGLEIDVLNFGKKHGEMSPTVGQKLSKIGLQLVGFGNQSTAAVEIRSVDTDAFELHADQRGGTWYYGIIANNCFSSESTFIKAAFDLARIGLDFSITDFTQGAIKIRSIREGSGFLINEGSSGELFGGPRFRDNQDQRNWLHMRAGDGGVRVVSRDAKAELLLVDNDGNVSIPGTLTIAGKRVDAEKLAALLDATPITNPPISPMPPLAGPSASTPSTLAHTPIAHATQSTLLYVVVALAALVTILAAALVAAFRTLARLRADVASLSARAGHAPSHAAAAGGSTNSLRSGAMRAAAHAPGLTA